jgi:hypothetical protein
MVLALLAGPMLCLLQLSCIFMHANNEDDVHV